MIASRFLLVEAIHLAGIPILSIPGVHGGFSIMPQYKVDKKIFTASDIAALLTGLGSVSSVIAGAETAGMLAKLKSLIPPHQAEEIELKSSQISIDLKPWMGNAKLPVFLEMIKTALQKQRLLAFQYTDGKGKTGSRKIEPHQLVLKENHWYVQGFCLEREAFRLFKLSRISELTLLENSFSFREIPAGISEFTKSMAQKQGEIQLLVQESALDRVREYCGDEQITPCGEKKYLVRFPFIADDAGYHLLFSFGDGCECLAPAVVRNEMIRRVENLARRYSARKAEAEKEDE